ncbi:hypothetical protein [Streptomyces sp. 184]|uniref:hypothetical protein n=1 Tax=Streptomyces sp. 184 TaxID=1827526 RepID=UPI003892B28E
MRKIHAALAGAVMTVTASTMFAGSAEAGPVAPAASDCASLWQQYAEDGYLRIYDGVDCTQYLDAAAGNDNNWNDNVGPIESHANDRATSLLNTGTYSGGISNIQFWQDANRRGNTGCLARADRYVRDLYNEDLLTPDGEMIRRADNRITSHHWRSSCTNRWR